MRESETADLVMILFSLQTEYPDVTVAELSDDQKNAISHRGKALRAMAAWLHEHASK